MIPPPAAADAVQVRIWPARVTFLLAVSFHGWTTAVATRERPPVDRKNKEA
jgi:hypothetical protein